MGNCCGKGSATKDPDKSPYAPAAKFESPAKASFQAPSVNINQAATENKPLLSVKAPELPSNKDITAKLSSSPVVELPKDVKPEVPSSAGISASFKAPKVDVSVPNKDSAIAGVKSVVDGVKDTAADIKDGTDASAAQVKSEVGDIKGQVNQVATGLRDEAKRVSDIGREKAAKVPDVLVTQSKDATGALTANLSPTVAGSIGLDLKAPEVRDDSSVSSVDDNITKADDVVLHVEENTKPENEVPALLTASQSSPVKENKDSSLSFGFSKPEISFSKTETTTTKEVKSSKDGKKSSGFGLSSFGKTEIKTSTSSFKTSAIKSFSDAKKSVKDTSDELKAEAEHFIDETKKQFSASVDDAKAQIQTNKEAAVIAVNDEITKTSASATAYAKASATDMKQEVQAEIKDSQQQLISSKDATQTSASGTLDSMADSLKDGLHSAKESTKSAIETVKDGAIKAKDGAMVVKDGVVEVKKDMSKIKDVAPTVLGGASNVKDGATSVKEGVMAAKEEFSSNKGEGAMGFISGAMKTFQAPSKSKDKTAEEKPTSPTSKTSKLPSPVSPSALQKRHEPSPSRDFSNTGLKMPSVNVKTPKSPTGTAQATISVSQDDAEGDMQDMFKGLSRVDATSSKTTHKGDEHVKPVNGVESTTNIDIQNENKAPIENDNNEVNVQPTLHTAKPTINGTTEKVISSAENSIPSLQSAVQDKSQVKLEDISKPLQDEVNDIKETEPKSISKGVKQKTPAPVIIKEKSMKIEPLLPDFTRSNDVVLKKHKYCANTRMSALENVDKWLEDKSEDKPRVMCVKGDPGMGKSTFCKVLRSKYGKRIAAYHFFNYNNSNLDHNDFKMVLLWIVRCFAKNIDSFSSQLPELSKTEEIIDTGNIEDISQQLIFAPLKKVQQEDPILVILDALDECQCSDIDKLFQFVDKFTRRVPTWLHLCVSFRSDNQLENQLSSVDMIEMKNDNQNMVDVKRMMRESLSPFMDRISLDGGLTQLAKKTHGSPLCAALYNRALAGIPKDNKIALREIDIKFATNIDGVLSNILSNFKKVNGSQKDLETKYTRLFGMLALAREPMNLTMVNEAGFKDIEETLENLNVMVDICDNDIVLGHRVISEWLVDQSRGDNLGVDVTTAKSIAAANCAAWLEPLMSDTIQDINSALTDYAVKHAVSHIIDKPKEQESVANVLCNLRVLDRKMALCGVHAVQRDYRHEHQQIDHQRKRMSLQEYINKTPRLDEQVKVFKHLIKNNFAHLKKSPTSLYQVAANYTKSPRIQQNARIELTSLPWLEDMTAVEETHCTIKSFTSEIISSDLSMDSKTLVFLTQDMEGNIHLHQYNVKNMEPKMHFVDVTNLEGRKNAKLCCKVLPDTGNIFVGSLSLFISNKGKSISSYYDTDSLQLKEKYATESCTVSSKYLAVSLTTFPFHGRSVHIALFGLKEKKALKTIEVLKFRFGGNAQFGVKACAISPDEKSLAACIKHNNKHEIKIDVYEIGSWNVLHTCALPCETLVKCDFGEQSTLLLSADVTKHERKSFAWKTTLQEGPTAITDDDSFSTIAVNKSHVAVIQVNQLSGSAQVMKWKKSQSVQKSPSVTYKINGVFNIRNLLLHSGVVICDKDTFKVYDPSDLEDEGTSLDNPKGLQLGDMSVETIAFMPRSDTMVINTAAKSTSTVHTCDMVGEELHLGETKLTGDTCTNKPDQQFFRGRTTIKQNCHVSADGSSYILNTGKEVLILSISTDDVLALPRPHSVPADATVKLCLPSPKESMIAVGYSSNENEVFLFDSKTMEMQMHMELESFPISDVSFMPSNGYLLTYHRNIDSKFIVWNQRTGKLVSEENADAAFSAVSPALDRIVLSKRNSSGECGLQLRSSDLKVSTMVDVGSNWSNESNSCDAYFSPDGTIFIATDMTDNFCRVFSAINGEALKNINICFTGAPFIVGMPTNTHLAVCDSRLTLLDIASGDVLCVASLPRPYLRKDYMLSVSPRGGVIAGVSSTIGRPIVYRLNNFTAIKMKTSLQRMKSFSTNQ